ncbi:hypothetical protein [Pedobacter agri]|uniref:hypothetical protein n=1 Tax=Pedobacter agri TaxID=454586 RepID=UPI00292F8251|nr:hypothetical protein [Pedobacter agri]
MIIKNSLNRLQSLVASKQTRADYIKLTTPLGNLFAASGIILSILSIIFFYKGCIEHSKVNYAFLVYGICLGLLASIAILFSVKINDRLIKEIGRQTMK